MFLEKIKTPRDVGRLDGADLPILASEVRTEIIKVCAANGGHLAASLGAVDISVALHHVFPESDTRMIWDTGHQAYAHKLLTGRLSSFASLRLKDGISGFLKRNESPYDHFGAGHACTALSASVGLSAAARLQGADRMTIAIMGDGAATGGLVYEAINNAKSHGGRLMVILNDNEMSISPNVGAITRVLTRLTSTRTFLGMESASWRILGRVPRIGGTLRNIARRAKHGIKHLILPSNFFEDFGFKYFGPIDGHDLNSMVKTLKQLKRIDEPVVLHVLTSKGRGYEIAEKNPTKYHGFAPFDPLTGEKISKGDSPLSYTESFGKALLELASKDDRIVAITAAMAPGTGLAEFCKLYPDRYFDVGIAEPHAVTFAAGLAAEGLRPVVAIYSTFLQRAFDMIVHDVALQNLPVVFVLDRAGVVGEDGPTHHGVLDLGYMRMVPGMVVMAPSDENELRHMMATALAHESGPIAIRYPRAAGLGIEEPCEMDAIELGCSRTLRDAEGPVVWALGSMVRPSMEAAERLASEGIEIKVVDARFAAPLDKESLRKDAGSRTLLISVEENSPVGGFGEGIAAFLREEGFDSTRHVSISLPSNFVGQASREELLHELKLDGEGLYKRFSKALATSAILAKGQTGRTA
jgi:1-deoxy-D-xylulose-5-phosphate synthase